MSSLMILQPPKNALFYSDEMSSFMNYIYEYETFACSSISDRKHVQMFFAHL